MIYCSVSNWEDWDMHVLTLEGLKTELLCCCACDCPAAPCLNVQEQQQK